MDYTVQDGTLWFNTWKVCALIAGMVYEFARHVENYNLIQIIFAFYKDGSNLPERTIWVKPYKFIKNISKSQKKTFDRTLSRELERTILFQSYCSLIRIY